VCNDIIEVEVIQNITTVDVLVEQRVTTVDVSVQEMGTRGVGVPSGGAVGEFLTKKSLTDYDTEWTGLANRPEIFFGTGDPPSAVGLADGTLYFKYKE